MNICWGLPEIRFENSSAVKSEVVEVILWLLLACMGEIDPVALSISDEELQQAGLHRLSLLYTGAMNGEIEPCG